MDESELICPISMEEFKYPIVLKCGHTFDKFSLEKLKTKNCPKCRMEFGDDDYIINWILVELLKLNINFDNNDLACNTSYTEKDALRDMKKILPNENLKVSTLLNKIILKIKKAASNGHNSCVYNINTLKYSLKIINIVSNKLKERGFYTKDWGECLLWSQLYILWL